MSLARLRPEQQRVLLGGLPVLVLGVTLLLALPRAVELRRLHREMTALRTCHAPPTTRHAGSGAVAGGRRGARGAPPAVRGEQDAFLNHLSTLMRTSNVRLVNFRPPDGGERAFRKESGEGSAILLPRVAEITVEGTYGDLIAFFQALEETERLLAPETLKITAQRHPRLTATFQLARFVVREPSRSP